MFCEGLLLPYRFKVEQQAYSFTCTLKNKIVKFIEIQSLPPYYSDHIRVKNAGYNHRLSS